MAIGQLPLQGRGAGVRFAGRLFHDHRPAELVDGAATASCRSPSPSSYSADSGLSGVPGDRRARRDQRVRAHVGRLGDERLLVGIAVGDERAVRGDDQGVAVGADADPVDHLPHFFEAELADEPAGGLVQARQANDEHRRRQQVVVHPDRGHGDAAEIDRRVVRDRDPRRADAARRHDLSRFVEDRDLAELAEGEHVVPDDGRLLALVEPGVLQIGAERLEDEGVAGHVAADFFGGAGRDVLVAADDRFPRAAVERPDRHDTVGDERQDGRQRQNQRESRGDAADLEGHRALVLGSSVVRSSTGRHRRRIAG